MRKVNGQKAAGRQKKSNVIWNLVMTAAVFVMIFSGGAIVKSLWEYHEGSKEYDILKQAVKKERSDTESGAGVVETDEELGVAGTEENPDIIGEIAGDDRTAMVQPIVTPFQEIHFVYLQEQNPDTVGWIEIPGTAIDYPIMQGEDNSYYLTRTFSGKENKAGSIFVESVNNGDLQDVHTILYGHNMKNGSMFGTLKKYRNEEYRKRHPYIYLYTPAHTYKYEIFACSEVSQDSDVYTVWYEADEAFGEFAKRLKEGSAYETGVSVSETDTLITLSTCVSIETNRFVVHAKRIECH